MGYGIITPTDAQTLERSLQLAFDTFPGKTLNLLEVGICHGDTARGVAEFCRGKGITFNYTGVDSQRDRPIVPPFEGARLVLGDSTEVYGQVPYGFHWAFIDGCHCINHFSLDFLHYGDLMVSGGIVAIHDAAPDAQGVQHYQTHGPMIDDFGIGVREGLRKMGLLGKSNQDWTLIEETWDNCSNYGGIAVYRRV